MIFFLLIPPPPRSTLFPYTTLFRSGTLPRGRRNFSSLLLVLRIAHQQQRAEVDRKSTRLNSSHVSISYAVFCLKKKNTTDSNSSHIFTGDFSGRLSRVRKSHYLHYR